MLYRTQASSWFPPCLHASSTLFLGQVEHHFKDKTVCLSSSVQRQTDAKYLDFQTALEG